jgi:hypothetical protein
MDLIGKLRRVLTRLAVARKHRRDESGRSGGGEGALPGGESDKEAAETNPQRAAELAD